MSFRVVIPARYASTRLPGKPLLEIAGRPLVLHVLERAAVSGAAEIVVATDDPRVADAVRSVGGDVEMTRTDHASGTDRLAEVAEKRRWGAHDIVVNLQGDEPLVPTDLPAQLADVLADGPDAGIATMATPIESAEDLFCPNVVKVVLDDSEHALYFSRAPIPWARDAFAAGQPSTLPAGIRYLRHIGLYAYRVDTLRLLASTPPSPLERAESLEQLRALEEGIRIRVRVVDQAPPHGVDTPEDLERLRRQLGA